MNKILLIAMLLISASSFAQMPKKKLPTPGNIIGKVIDKKTKEALPYVNIVIRDTVNKIITGGITDETGNFNVNDIPEGNSIIEVQYIGFKIYSKKINITKKAKIINLETIALEEDSATLDEVVVRAETSTVVQKVDRKVINVGKDLTSAGTSASELLNNIQSVNVDSQSGDISLRGNGNVRVLVDGKPTNISSAQLLKQIPSTSIKSIELITNPSAKYNPEGMSGIINIILNKNANMGFNGSLDTGITVGHYARYNASTNINYKTGKVNFFANYGYNGGDNFNKGFVNRTDSSILQNFQFINKNQSHLIKIGADYYINNKNTLSFYTTQNRFVGGGNGSTKITQNQTLISNATNLQDQKTNTGTYNLNYKIDFEKERHNLEFEVTYSKTDNPEDAINRDFTRSSNDIDYKLLNYTNEIENYRNNTLINIDYTNPVSKNGKLELGIEYRTNKTDNNNISTQDEYNSDGSLSPYKNSSFNYDRKILSSYLNYDHNFGKLTMQIGTRIEQLNVDADFYRTKENQVKPYTDNQLNIYPSAFFTYSPSEKNQWQVSYSRRVDRPSIQQVNPIREWSTPIITSIGNPILTPQFTNSFELNYTRQIKNGSLTVGTFYRRINDVISRITYRDILDPNNRGQILSFTNFDDTSSYGLEFSANYKVNNWWRINSSMDFYSQKQFGITDLNNPNASRIDIQNEVFNARISNSFKASKNLKLQLFALYKGPSEDIQWKVESMWMVNTGASLTVLKGKGTVNFRVNDIFKGMKFAFNSSSPFVQNGKFNWESQTAYLGFNYRFGNGKNKAKRRRLRDDNTKQNSGGF